VRGVGVGVERGYNIGNPRQIKNLLIKIKPKIGDPLAILSGKT
jgi:hypothetical protein